MMKRILSFMAAAIAGVIAFSSCEDSKPSIEFEKSLYVLSETPTVSVTVVTSEPVSSDITVPLSFSGTAVKDKDFTVSSASVTIAAGQRSGSVDITNTAVSSSSIEELTATVSMTVPSGYEAGNKSTTIVSLVPKETLVYSFASESADVLGSFKTKITITGSVSGSSVRLADDLTVPLTVTGDAASHIVFKDDKPQAVVSAGNNYAYIEFTVSDGYKDGDKAVIGVNTTADSRFIPGDNETFTASLYNLKVPEGTYTFSKVFDDEELSQFFEDLQDDSSLLPLKNEGFTLTFSTDEDGNHIVEPGGTGDFANFFRKSVFVPTTPKNYSNEGTVTGKFTVSECTMFMAEAGYQAHTNIYYELQTANRAFSKTKETLGKAVIVFTIMDEGLVVEFRDYDKPPFGENWAVDWGKFDADMFSFASLFVKK